MTPMDSFERALESVLLSSSLRPRPGRPGEVIERLPTATRAALQALQSADLASVSPGRIALMCPRRTLAEWAGLTETQLADLDARLRARVEHYR